MATQCPGTTCKTEDDAFVSIIDGIRKKALSHPDSPALSFLPDGKAENAELCSYSRLDMRARAIAAAIQATGQGDGRPVLLMLPPGLEFIAAFFGCLYARAIAVPMTPPGLARMARTFNRLARIVEDSGSRVFITSARLRKAVEELAERVHFADSIRIICLDETDDALSRSWQELPLTTHTPGWLQYTSGSTSSPKGVIITHGNIMANLDSIAGHMRLRENIPTVSWLPPFHDMGLVGGILTPLHLGCLCVTMPPMAFLRQPLCWLRAVTHYRAQLTGGPNFAYDLCCDRIPEDRLRELDLSSLSVCYCGSEPIRLKTIRRFLERFSSAGLDPASFYPCYGLAENTLFTTGCWKNDGDFAVFLDKQEYAAGRIRFLQEQHADAMPLLSCGTAGRNNDVRIVDPQTCREVEEKELGEIWIRGTCVSPGYWEQPEATKTVLHAVLAGSGEGPFLRTGDMGFMSGGHLFVSGRCKEMIILNGRNFFPQDLEECVLQNVPGLEQNGAAAFGIDSDAGERLVMVFETRLPATAHEATLAAIRRSLSEEFDISPCAVVLCKRHGVPKTTSGKIQQSLCRHLYLHGELPVLAEWREEPRAGAPAWTRPPQEQDAPASREAWQNWLRDGLSARLGLSPDSVGLHTPFSSLGMGSATAVALTGELQQACGRPLPATLFYDHADIASLASFMAGDLSDEAPLPAHCAGQQAVAIIGMACRLPGADSPEALEALLFGGKDAITRRDPAHRDGTAAPEDGDRAVWGGFLDDISAFDAALFGISPREAVEIDPQQRLLLEVSWQALERAGIAPDSLRRSRTGVFTGISSSDYENRRLQCGQSLNAYVGTGNAHSIAANRLSYFYGFEGPSMAVDSACSSSLLALHLACRSLRDGECETALACGVNILAGSEGQDIFTDAHLMAPDGRCKTFSADADGYVRAEGCVVLVLKTLERALNDQDPILGIVRGSAVNQDGRSNGLTAPSRRAQARLLREALHNAGLTAADIDGIEAHGTGTPLGDPIEFGAISDVYSGSREADRPLLVSSIKTNVGHLEAAAGLAGVCRVLISLQAAAIPPHLHLKRLNPEIRTDGIPAAIPVATTPWPRTPGRPRRAGVSSFGFGGTNVHVILEEAPLTDAPSGTLPGPLPVLPLAAASEGQLRELAADYREHLARAPEREMADACLTCGAGRASLPCRAALAGPDIVRGLEQLASGMPVPFMGHVPDSAPHRPVVFFLNSMTGCPDASLPDVPPLASARTALLEQLPSGTETDGQARAFLALMATAEAWRRMLGEPAAILCTPATVSVAACLAGHLDPEEGLALYRALEGDGALIPQFKVRAPEAGTVSLPLFDLGSSRLISAEEARDPAFWRAYAPTTGAPEEAHAIAQARRLAPSADILAMRPGDLPDGNTADTPLLLPAFAPDAAATPQHMAAVLACCWTRGTNVRWAAVHAGSAARRIPLPTYPFAREHFWFGGTDMTDAPAALPARRSPAPLEIPDVSCVMQETARADRLDDAELLALLSREARAVLRLPENVSLSPETPLVRAGFDSLLFMELAQRLSRRLGMTLPPALLMETATLAALRERLCLQGQTAPAPQAMTDIVARPEDRHLPFPLTDVQHAYWIGRDGSMTLGGVSCSNYVEADFTGLDVPRLEKALDALVRRHDMLRCVITPDGRQRVLPAVPACRIPLEDLSALPEEEKERVLRQKREQLSHKVLPTDKAPLLEITASRLDAATIRLHVKLDLLVADAYSFGILMQDLAAWYADPGMEKSPLALSFRDCVLAAEAEKDTPAWQADREYWLQRLPFLPAGPELPLARTPQSLGTPRFHRRTAMLDAARWARLKEMGRAQGLTPSGLLLAAFSLVLSRWTAQPHFCLMLTTFDRRYRHEEMGAVVGDFTRLLLLEVQREKGATFLEHATALGRQLIRDMGHSRFSAVDVLRELAKDHGEDMTSSRSAVVFTSALPLSGDDPFAAADGLGAKLAYAVSQTPQVWLDHQVCEYRGQLVYTWDAVEDLFPSGMLDAMFTVYGDFLTALCEDAALWQQPVPLHRLPASQADVRHAANATEAAIPPRTLFAPFLDHASRDGAPAAVIGEGVSLSRAEAESISRLLGNGLRSRGLRPGEIVAVMMEKGWEQVVAVMGILRAGGAYLPVSPSLPDKRIAYMFKDAGVRFCFVQPGLEARAEACGSEAVPVLRAFPEQAAPAAAPLPDTDVSPEGLAYVIYTSGSTGLPKGVMVSHAAAHNTLADLGQRLGLGPRDRVIALASLSFDLSVFDLFGVTAAGGAVVIPAPGQERDPAAWCRLMREQGVTVWNSTPSLMQLLLDYLDDHPEDRPERLRLALLSGDWIPLAMPDRMHALWPDMTVAALGGATEAAIWSNIQIVDHIPAEWHSIPYGRPLANQGYLVLDQDLCPCPDLVAGDLYITGAGLARGYLNDPSKTAAAFFRHPRSGQALYRTGDLGRYWPDGTLEFLGRKDSQVKINGFRIELGEVERALNALPGVGNAAVIALRSDKGDRLAGFVSPAPQAVMPAPSDESPEAREARYRSMRDAGITLVDDVERLAYKQAGHNLRKDLDSLPRIGLATEDEATSLSLFSRRISSRRFTEAPMEREAFERLLGCLRGLDIPQWPVVRHRYGSAGWTYAVQVYVLVRPGRIRELDGGCYYYHPLENALVRMADAPEDAATVFPGHNADIFSHSAFALFLVADMEAIRPLYGDRSEEFVLIEAGLMSQLLEETAMEQRAGLCQIGALDFDRLRDSFSLGAGHRYLHCLTGGAVTREPGWDFTRALAESLPHQAAAGGLSPEDLQGLLRQWLPDYMVPQTLTVIDAIPLTANGKVDRRQLAALGAGPAAGPACVHPEGETEEQLTAIIRDMLGKETVSVLDNFFDLGATSLQLVLFQRRISELLHRQVAITDIFAHPNIRDLAAFLAPQGGEDSAEDAMSMAGRRARLRRQMRRPGPAHVVTPRNFGPQDSLPGTESNS